MDGLEDKLLTLRKFPSHQGLYPAMGEDRDCSTGTRSSISAETSSPGPSTPSSAPKLVDRENYADSHGYRGANENVCIRSAPGSPEDCYGPSRQLPRSPPSVVILASEAEAGTGNTCRSQNHDSSDGDSSCSSATVGAETEKFLFVSEPYWKQGEKNIATGVTGTTVLDPSTKGNARLVSSRHLSPTNEDSATVGANGTGWASARSRGGSPPTPGKWVPPPTMWGGMPVTPSSSWGWFDTETGGSLNGAIRGYRNLGNLPCKQRGDEEGGNHDTTEGDDDRRLKERQQRWRQEIPTAAAAEFASTVTFRTSDGRSLFSETLGTLGNRGIYTKGFWSPSSQSNVGNGSTECGGDHIESVKRRNETLLGDERKRRREGSEGGGLYGCGNDQHCGNCGGGGGGNVSGPIFAPSATVGGTGKGLGLAARLRRNRIDGRSRDEKRREEAMFTGRKIRRLADEVTVKLRCTDDGSASKQSHIAEGIHNLSDVVFLTGAFWSSPSIYLRA